MHCNVRGIAKYMHCNVHMPRTLLFALNNPSSSSPSHTLQTIRHPKRPGAQIGQSEWARFGPKKSARRRGITKGEERATALHLPRLEEEVKDHGK